MQFRYPFLGSRWNRQSKLREPDGISDPCECNNRKQNQCNMQHKSYEGIYQSLSLFKEAGAQIVDGQGVQEEAAMGLEEGDAWAIAQRMGLEAERKQGMLEMTSENARLQNLAE